MSPTARQMTNQMNEMKKADKEVAEIMESLNAEEVYKMYCIQ